MDKICKYPFPNSIRSLMDNIHFCKVWVFDVDSLSDHNWWQILTIHSDPPILSHMGLFLFYSITPTNHGQLSKPLKLRDVPRRWEALRDIERHWEMLKDI